MVILNPVNKYMSLNYYINNYVYKYDARCTKPKSKPIDRYNNNSIIDQIYSVYNLPNKKNENMTIKRYYK